MNDESLLKECIDLLVEKKLKEVDVTDGSKVKFGSKKHIADLERRISDLVVWRDRQKRGTEARANYSRLISRLKGELSKAKSQSQKQLTK